MARYMYKVGDIVKYIGNDTGSLRNQIGVVVEESPCGSVKLKNQHYDSVPVEWFHRKDNPYYGVYWHNLEFMYKGEPAWEV